MFEKNKKVANRTVNSQHKITYRRNLGLEFTELGYIFPINGYLKTIKDTTDGGGNKGFLQGH